MNQTRLQQISDPYFNEAWQLYEEAFPPEERKDLTGQVLLLEKTPYHYDVVLINGMFIGFVLWWEFEDLRYIEHFATTSDHRNKGYGKLILEKFIKDNQVPIILEVELPYAEINKRRIKFYERIGFILCPHFYEIPPLHEGWEAEEYLLMSYPSPLNEEDVASFVKKYHPIIFED